MFELRAKSKTETDILLYGSISQWDEVRSSDFVKAVNKAKDEGYTVINLRINSPGGSIFEGLAIATKIRMSDDLTINAYIDGIAASMASVIACSCDKVFIAKGARMMIHQGSGSVWGSSKKIRDYADLLDSLNRTLADIYAVKTGKEKDWIIKNWMAEGKDTWFSDDAAVTEMLADEVVQGKIKPLVKEAATFMEMAAHYEQQFENETIMKKEELIALLGLKAEATEAEISAALKAMKDKADKKETSAGGDPIANVLAIAKERGVTDEKQMAAIKKLAAVDAQAALDMLPAKAEEKKEEAKKESPAPLALADVITALKGDGTEAKSDKKNWDWNEWSKHPKEFEVLLQSNVKEYIRLFKAEFNYEPTEDELKSVVFKR